MEDTLIRFNPHWTKALKDETQVRHEYLNEILKHLENKEILFLVGIRRVGKTTLMKQTINHLISEKKIPAKNVLFLSCDNITLSNKTLFDIIEVYRKINSIKFEERFYLFIDEVAYMSNFSQQLKNLYDSWDLKILCSSSNVIHLEDKKAFLTGRTRTINVHPLSYERVPKFQKSSASEIRPRLKRIAF